MTAEMRIPVGAEGGRYVVRREAISQAELHTQSVGGT